MWSESGEELGSRDTHARQSDAFHFPLSAKQYARLAIMSTGGTEVGKLRSRSAPANKYISCVANANQSVVNVELFLYYYLVSLKFQ